MNTDQLDCECVSNAKALFCADLGTTTISCLNFANWIYHFSLFRYSQVHINQFYLMQEHMPFCRHLLPRENLNLTLSYYHIIFFNPLKVIKLILKLIDFLVGAKSPHYYYVLHIVSNFAFFVFNLSSYKNLDLQIYIM